MSSELPPSSRSGPELWPLVLTLLALWPLAGWFLERVGTAHEEEPLGWALALVAFAALVVRELRSRKGPFPVPGVGPRLALAGWLGIHAAAFPLLPGLPRAVLGVGALGLAVSAWPLAGRPLLAPWGLLVLSLRITPALQSYVGFPLREVVSSLTARLLGVFGMTVRSQGVVLLEGSREVLVDAPCSGLRMLWTGAFLLLVLAARERLSSGRTALALALAVPLLVLGNVLRCALLFLEATERLPLPPGGHGLVGLLLFATLAVPLVLLVRGLAPADRRLGPSDRPRGDPPPTDPGPPPRAQRAASVLVVLAALGAAWAPFRSPPPPPSTASFPGWPERLLGDPLEPTPLLAAEAALPDLLPGRFAAFQAGPRRVHLAWLTRPTSRLHARSACSRAWGYQVRSLPDWVDETGVRWGSLVATREDDAVWLRERVEDVRGVSFSSVHDWYLAALLGRTTGPWWVSFLQEPLPERRPGQPGIPAEEEAPRKGRFPHRGPGPGEVQTLISSTASAARKAIP